MNRLLFTRELATIFGCPIHRVQGLVTRDKVKPQVVAGRTVWTPDEALRAAKLLGVDTPQVRNALAGTTPASGARE